MSEYIHRGCSAYCGVLHCKLEPHHEGLHVAKGSGLLWGDAANGAGYTYTGDDTSLQKQVVKMAKLVGPTPEEQMADRDQLLDQIRELKAQIDQGKNMICDLREENGELKKREDALVDQLADALSRMTEAEVRYKESTRTDNDPRFIVRMQLLEELNTALMRIWQLDLRRRQEDLF